MYFQGGECGGKWGEGGEKVEVGSWKLEGVVQTFVTGKKCRHTKWFYFGVVMCKHRWKLVHNLRINIHITCVCVYVHTHTHPPTHSHTSFLSRGSTSALMEYYLEICPNDKHYKASVDWISETVWCHPVCLTGSMLMPINIILAWIESVFDRSRLVDVDRRWLNRIQLDSSDAAACYWSERQIWLESKPIPYFKHIKRNRKGENCLDSSLFFQFDYSFDFDIDFKIKKN